MLEPVTSGAFLVLKVLNYLLIILLPAVLIVFAYLQGLGIVLVLLTLMVAILAVYTQVLTSTLKEKDSRISLAKWLEKTHYQHFHWGDRHREIWGRFLSYLERKISRKAGSPVTPPSSFWSQPRFFFRPQVLIWWLPFAYCYPVALLLLGWLGGGQFDLSGEKMDLPAIEWWRKSLLIIVFFGFGALLIWSSRNAERIEGWLNRRIFAFLPGWLKNSAGALAGAGTLAVTGALAGALAGAGALALTFSLGIAVACVGALAGALAGAVAVAVAIAICVGVSVGVVLGIVEASYMLDNLLLLYLFLPFINAMADYLSWGLSRWLLWDLAGGEKRWQSLSKAFIDGIAVLVFLMLLSFSLPFFLGGASSLLQWFFPTAQVIDLSGYIEAAAQAPFSKGLAVTGMLFTTFLPTLMHLVAFVVSICLPLGSKLVTRKLLISLRSNPRSPHIAVMGDLGRLIWVVFALPALILTTGLLAVLQAYEYWPFFSAGVDWFFGRLRDIAFYAWGLWGY
jgi:hypothetical protein